MPRDASIDRIAGKELTLFFASPVAWLFLGSFAAVTLFAFFWGEAFFARNVADVRPLFEWMPVLLIFLSAALTMRMWSEERRTGTLEHVLTQPVALWRFVVGKFRACVTLLALALAITLPLPVTVSLLGELDWGPVFAGYLAALLLGAAYISVGLFVSARSDNSIVSLIGSVALCGLLYLLGSALLTSFFGNFAGELLRSVGSGARFESITRGVIDIRDLVYYLSLIALPLCLNVHSLERERWAATGSRVRHLHWRRITALAVANALAANLWLSQVGSLRGDVTEGGLFSISDATHAYLDQLREPLLLRGYFSAKTHPLLAPLAPRMRDLMKEYEVAGRGKVRVEIVDPADDPELEQEANTKYGIRAVPFQVADRYQAALVNSYFNVLVEYGDSHQVLGFEDLIEVKAGTTASLDVQLRNPEFDLTRAIKQVLYSYRAGGNLFDGIDGDIELIAYVSADERLPEQLVSYRQLIGEQLAAVEAESGGRFSTRFLEPEAGDGGLAGRIEEQWGFKPMVTGLFDDNQFYFYLTLANDRQVVQLPVDFDPDNFRQALDAGLKRFARGFTRIVAFSAPRIDPQLARFGTTGPQFRNLENAVTENHGIRAEDLNDGAVTPEADMLMVVAPENLDEKQLFAIDQFLMRGGSVVLATSPYMSQLTRGSLTMVDRTSGLRDWLAHHGIGIGESLVLDPQNSAFPIPVTREVGGFRFQEVAMVDYPFFVDARPPGLNPDHPITGGVPQVTLAWASPLDIDAEANAAREVTELIRSSDRAWTSDSLDVLPRVDASGVAGWQAQGQTGGQLLAAIVGGRFDSYFAGKPSPLMREEEEQTDAEERSDEGENGEENPEREDLTVGSVIERSPESARLIVYASNDFLTDQILGTISSMTGAQYLGPLEMMANTLDWALEDGGLLGIRSHSHFNRSLAPLEKDEQLFWEYLNYALALAALSAIALWQRRGRLARRRAYLEQLGEVA